MWAYITKLYAPAVPVCLISNQQTLDDRMHNLTRIKEKCGQRIRGSRSLPDHVAYL